MAKDFAAPFGVWYHRWMTGLTILLVPVWLLLAWLFAFLLGMARAGRAPSPFVSSFDGRHIVLIALAIPFGAWALGWYGVAHKLRRVALAGIVLLAAWLSFPIGLYFYARTIGNMPPGSWADRDFQISEDARNTYRVLRFGHVAGLRFSSPKVLFAQSTAATRLPLFADVEARTEEFPGLIAKAGVACGDKLHEVAYSFRPFPRGSTQLVGNFFRKDPSQVSALYRSVDGRWLALCLSGRVCDLLFRNEDSLTSFSVQQGDLCLGPVMNRHLVSLTKDWVR